MTSVPNLTAVLEASAGKAFNGLVAGLIVVVVIACLLKLARRQNPGTRFAVWLSALLTVAALPIVSIFLGSHARDAASIVSQSPVTLPGFWAVAVFATWACVSAFAIARIGMGLVELRKFRSSCQRIDLAAHPLLLQTVSQQNINRDVVLCSSDGILTPTAVGFFKPAVVLPNWVLEELSPEELNSVVLHELAHLSRRDDWTNLLQKVVKALLFFHPAVWWIENQLSLEREMACDGAVIAATANPRVYARCLVSLAERAFGRRGMTLAQAAVSRLHQLSARIKQVLDDNRVPGTRIAKPAVAGSAVLSVVGLLALSGAPQIVEFEDVQPVTHASNHMARGGSQGSASPLFVKASFSDRQTSSSASVPPSRTSKQLQRSTGTASLDTTREKSSALLHSSQKPLQASFRQASLPLQKERPASRKLTSGAPEVLLLMQTTMQYDDFETASGWSLQIVQLTVFHQVATSTVKQNPPKSI